jgi:hypothetical protein
VKLWTERRAASTPVDEAGSSPTPAHSAVRLPERERGVIPVLHTPYDYDKGIS